MTRAGTQSTSRHDRLGRPSGLRGLRGPVSTRITPTDRPLAGGPEKGSRWIHGTARGSDLWTEAAGRAGPGRRARLTTECRGA